VTGEVDIVYLQVIRCAKRVGGALRWRPGKTITKKHARIIPVLKKYASGSGPKSNGLEKDR
jgi:hypothetical protein